MDLSGAGLVAIDGSFFHGHVAKHSIHTRARQNKRLKHIEAHTQQPLQQLATSSATPQACAPDNKSLAARRDALKTR